MPEAGLAVHQRLGPLVGAGRAALDQIGRQRERGAGETDQGCLAQLARQRTDGLVDVRQVARFERT